VLKKITPAKVKTPASTNIPAGGITASLGTGATMLSRAINMKTNKYPVLSKKPTI
jgi:hypothetical protein